MSHSPPFPFAEPPSFSESDRSALKVATEAFLKALPSHLVAQLHNIQPLPEAGRALAIVVAPDCQGLAAVEGLLKNAVRSKSSIAAVRQAAASA